MSVYIPGISKPTSCYDCPCANGDRMRCQVAKRDFGFFEDTRPDWCPLIPIPEHGRLIDESMIPWCVDWYAGRKRYYTTPKNIEHLPTIIPADQKEEQTVYDSLKTGLEQAVNGEYRTEAVTKEETE